MVRASLQAGSETTRLADSLELRGRAGGPGVREPVLVALNILLHDNDVSVEDAKVRAAERGTRITAASVNSARNLISKMDGAQEAPAT